MKEYEMIQELFDNCSMQAQSSFFEIETDDLDAFMHEKRYIMPNCEWTKDEVDGSIVYDIYQADIHSRYTFTEI